MQCNNLTSLLALLNVILQEFSNRCVYQVTDGTIHVHLGGEISHFNINAQSGLESTSNLPPLQLIRSTNECPGLLITTQNEANVHGILYNLWYRTPRSRMHDMKVAIVSITSNMTKILESPMMSKLANVVLLDVNVTTRKSLNIGLDLQCINGNIHCYTTEFLEQHRDPNDANELTLVDIWDTSKESFIYKNMIFPDKIGNRKGRIWVMGYQNIPIYFNFATKSGCSLKALYEYARARNISIEPYVFSPTEYIYGDVLVNYTHLEHTDVAVANLFLSIHRYSKAGTLSAFSGAAITCLVPISPLVYSWAGYLIIFQKEVWFLFITTNLLVFLILRLTKNNKNSLWILILSIATQQSTNINKIKIWSMILIFFTQLVAMYYSSNLSAMIISPDYGERIETVAQLIQSNSLWHSQDKNAITPIKDAKSAGSTILVKNFRPIDQQTLDELIKDARTIFAVARSVRSQTMTYPGEVSKETLLKYGELKDNIFVGYVTMYLHKHSQHLNDFWQFMMLLIDTGLMLHWEEEGTKDDLHLDRYTNVAEAQAHVPLSIAHTKGAFALWAIGILAAQIAFVWEFASSKHKKIQRSRQKTPKLL